MQPRLLCIDPAIVNVLWPLAREFIARAILRTGLSDLAEVEASILSGKYLLWLAWNGEAIEAAAATQLIRVNGRKICVLVACSGRARHRWLPLLEEIEDYARKEGCVRMRLGGRKGWERVLNGYRGQYVTLEKDLN